MFSLKNIVISITAILLIANFADAFGKKKPKEKEAAETTAEAPKEVQQDKAAPAAPAEAAPAPTIIAPPAKETNDPNTPKVDPNALVVTVNGTKITEGQINKILDARMEQRAGKIPPNMKDQFRQQMRKNIIQQLVIEQILTEKEKEKNITVSQQDVNDKIAEQMKQQNLNLDEFKALLKNYGTNYSDYEDNMRKRLAFEKLMEFEFADKIQKPTEEQAKAFYDENIEQFREPEKIHTKHILIKPADSNDPNKAKAQARAKAEDILKKVKEGGNFEELAKQYSACPSGKNGGDLGEAPKGSFVPAFEAAAYKLEPNQVSDIVETEFGYHIIKMISHTDANTTSFEKAREKIEQHLSNKQKEQVVMNYISQIKQQADIKFVDPNDNFEIPVSRPEPARQSTPAASADANKTEPNTRK